MDKQKNYHHNHHLQQIIFSRLIDFFKNNNAEDKIITVEILIEKYKGNEKQIFQALKTKYEQGKNNNIAKSNAWLL